MAAKRSDPWPILVLQYLQPALPDLAYSARYGRSSMVDDRGRKQFARDCKQEMAGECVAVKGIVNRHTLMSNCFYSIKLQCLWPVLWIS